MSLKKRLENSIYYLEIDGSLGHREIGRQHGEAFREEIGASIRYIKGWYKDTMGEHDALALYDQLFNGSHYMRDLAYYLPHIHEEFLGLAEGSGYPLQDLMLINYLDEGFLLLVDHQQKAKGKCTNIGVAANARYAAMLGQNLDFTAAYNGFQALFHIHYPKRNILLYSFTGQLMGMGINSEALSIVANTIVNGTVNLGNGVPNTLLARAFFECSTVAECRQLLEKCPRSTSTAWIIGGKDGMACMESTVAGVTNVPMESQSGYAHTNHLLASDDVRDVDGVSRGKTILPASEGFSWEKTEERLAIAKDFLRNKGDVMTPEDMMRFFSEPPILRDYGDPTIQTCISVIDEEIPCIYIAQGDSPNRKFVRVDCRLS